MSTAGGEIFIPYTVSYPVPSHILPSMQASRTRSLRFTTTKLVWRDLVIRDSIKHGSSDTASFIGQDSRRGAAAVRERQLLKGRPIVKGSRTNLTFVVPCILVGPFLLSWVGGGDRDNPKTIPHTNWPRQAAESLFRTAYRLSPSGPPPQPPQIAGEASHIHLPLWANYQQR